jgi:hypothetical protein
LFRVSESKLYRVVGNCKHVDCLFWLLHSGLRFWRDIVFQVYFQSRWIINWVSLKTCRSLDKVFVIVETSLELGL